nr:hypothetical protein [Tanacetum cinerariifolium]
QGPAAVPRLATAGVSATAMGPVVHAQAAAPLASRPPRRAVHRHRRPAGVQRPACGAAFEDHRGQRLSHQLPAIFHAVRPEPADA